MTCPCGRPVHAKGRCMAHYQAARRDVTNRRSHLALVPDTGPRPGGASDQGFVTDFRDLTQNPKTVFRDGVIWRGDYCQLIGVYCPDCRGETIATAGGFPIRRKPEVAWCVSDRHPVFDITGRVA